MNCLPLAAKHAPLTEVDNVLPTAAKQPRSFSGANRLLFHDESIRLKRHKHNDISFDITRRYLLSPGPSLTKVV